MFLAASQLVKVQSPAAEAGEVQQAVAGAVPRLLVVQAGLKDWGSSGLESPPRSQVVPAVRGKLSPLQLALSGCSRGL